MSWWPGMKAWRKKKEKERQDKALVHMMTEKKVVERTPKAMYQEGSSYLHKEYSRKREYIKDAVRDHLLPMDTANEQMARIEKELVNDMRELAIKCGEYDSSPGYTPPQQTRKQRTKDEMAVIQETQARRMAAQQQQIIKNLEETTNKLAGTWSSEEVKITIEDATQLEQKRAISYNDLRALAQAKARPRYKPGSADNDPYFGVDSGNSITFVFKCMCPICGHTNSVGIYDDRKYCTNQESKTTGMVDDIGPEEHSEVRVRYWCAECQETLQTFINDFNTINPRVGKTLPGNAELLMDVEVPDEPVELLEEDTIRDIPEELM